MEANSGTGRHRRKKNSFKPEKCPPDREKSKRLKNHRSAQTRNRSELRKRITGGRTPELPNFEFGSSGMRPLNQCATNVVESPRM